MGAGGFAFLPQVYVNDFGIVRLAGDVRAQGHRLLSWALSAIHPTVGSYQGDAGLRAGRSGRTCSRRRGTVGFSVYTAETEMTADDWQAYGQAIRTMHIAAGVS